MRRYLLFISIAIFIIVASRTLVHARDVIVTACDFASLQSAVAVANDGGGVITFDCTGTIVFTHQLTITNEVYIIGGEDIIFDGGGTTRLFWIGDNGSLTLTDLTLQNGVASYGGAIFTAQYGKLIIRNSIFLNNSTQSFEQYPRYTGGGAIYNFWGSITISNSTFSNNAGGAIKNGGWITINDSTFTDNPDGAINNIYGGRVTINYSTFTNNAAENGGAIQNGSIAITHSTFTGNSATDSGGAIFTDGWVTISDSTFTDNVATHGGAIAGHGMLDNGGKLVITNTRFTGNSASDNGGAIYHTGDEITLTGDTFLNNSATIGQSGIFSNGLVRSKNTQYENNTCGGYGVFADDGDNIADNALGCPPDVVPMGTTVTDCVNFMGIGTISQAVTTANASNQPITFACSGTIVFTSSLFIRGDILIIGNGDIIFDGNGETGFFHVGSASKEFPMPNEVIIPASLLIDGVTLQNSGRAAIYNTDNGTFTANNSTFSHNSGNYGGAISNYGVLNISNSTFSHNSASQDGGAIHSYNTMLITTSTFTDNTAKNGEAIMNHGRLSIQNTYFENNTCGGRGIFMNNGGNMADNASGCPSDIPASTVVSDCDNFTGVGTLSEAVSIANMTGEPITFTCSGTIVFTEPLSIGGIVTINGEGNITLETSEEGALFTLWGSDISLILNDLTLQSGDTGSGLLINIYQGVVVINNSMIRGNSIHGSGISNSGKLTINNSTFTGSLTKGFSLYSVGWLTINNSTFADNHHDYTRGIVYTRGIATISNSTFSNNSGEYGGAITNEGTLTVINSTFADNSASRGGGAIFNDTDATLTITDSIFTGNSTSRNGGAIISGGRLTITNSTFSDNVADSCGAISNSSTLTIANNTFENNSATENGGAICNGHRLSITHSTFTNNSANQGGAIFNQQSDYRRGGGESWLTIANSTLSDNVATDGGAIFNVHNGILLSQDTHYENNDCVSSGVFTDNGGNIADNADGCPDES